jgi:HK97 family phage major capsid protein
MSKSYAVRVVTICRGYETLTDPAGGIFLPANVADFVFNIAGLYGFVAGNALRLPISTGSQKVPNVTGALTFYATGENQEILASKSSFGGIDLKPLLWGTIVPWTLQIEREAGARLVPIVVSKMGEALAKAQDDAFLKGDGTSAFHGIRGVTNRVAAGTIPFYAPPAPRDLFAELTADDWYKTISKLAPSVRGSAVWVMHPDREEQIRLLKDGDGRYVFAGPSGDNGPARLWGRPIFYTESGYNTDGQNQPVAALCDPRYLAFGVMDDLTVDRLTEATIKDVDGVTDIRLGSQYSAALRAVSRWDIGFGDQRAFALFRTGPQA